MVSSRRQLMNRSLKRGSSSSEAGMKGPPSAEPRVVPRHSETAAKRRGSRPRRRMRAWVSRSRASAAPMARSTSASCWFSIRRSGSTTVGATSSAAGLRVPSGAVRARTVARPSAFLRGSRSASALLSALPAMRAVRKAWRASSASARWLTSPLMTEASRRAAASCCSSRASSCCLAESAVSVLPLMREVVAMPSHPATKTAEPIAMICCQLPILMVNAPVARCQTMQCSGK